MKRTFYLLLMTSMLVSCKINQLYLTVVEPAPVTLSKEIKKVGVINRSMPTDQTKVLDVIDKVLSLEGADLDSIGAEQCIIGLSDELMSNNRFTQVKALNNYDFRTPKLGLFPNPLSWEIVARICRETGNDALFSLEYYDTDARISYSANKTDIKTGIGITIPALEHTASMETIVKTGWRIYDPASQIIADEFNHLQSVAFSGRGINPLVAVAALINRKDAIKEVSNKAGHGYALRILPFELRVMRDYFVKGTNNFKIGKRLARVGKWNEAGVLWEKETANPDLKIAGRACHNMGIISEINGDVDTALAWAQKAYEYHNIRQALKYTRILEDRMMKRQLLKEQEPQP